MALNLYAFRERLKARIALPDDDDDEIIDEVLRAISREVDTYCGRQFFPVIQTRQFGATSPHQLLVDDILSVTALATDDDGDRVYETAWGATDYELEPANAALQSPPRPYWQICTAPNGRYSFPCGRRGVEISGAWGYYDVLDTSTATLAEDLDASETAVDVTSGAAFTPGQVIVIDSERLEISAIGTNTLTVERGINGTTAAAHTIGATIRVATFPVITQAVMNEALLQFRAKDMPQGIQGGSEFGSEIRAVYSSGLHPFTKRQLTPFRLVRAG